MAFTWYCVKKSFLMQVPAPTRHPADGPGPAVPTASARSGSACSTGEEGTQGQAACSGSQLSAQFVRCHPQLSLLAPSPRKPGHTPCQAATRLLSPNPCHPHIHNPCQCTQSSFREPQQCCSRSPTGPSIRCTGTAQADLCTQHATSAHGLLAPSQRNA